MTWDPPPWVATNWDAALGCKRCLRIETWSAVIGCKRGLSVETRIPRLGWERDLRVETGTVVVTVVREALGCQP